LGPEIQRASDTSTREGDDSVWVSKVNEFIGSSSAGFEGAALEVVERASRTLRGITGIEILDKSVKVEDGAVVEYRVKLRLLFDMAPESDLHW
jgi:flavin-binding protein dodecin